MRPNYRDSEATSDRPNGRPRFSTQKRISVPIMFNPELLAELDSRLAIQNEHQSKMNLPKLSRATAIEKVLLERWNATLDSEHGLVFADSDAEKSDSAPSASLQPKPHREWTEEERQRALKALTETGKLPVDLE